MNEKTNQHSYDKISAEWGKVRDAMPINKCIADFCKLLKPKGNVLDVGCGTGKPIAEYLTRQGFNVVGLDFSHEMIERACANVPTAKFVECDLFDFSCGTKFDGIIAFDSLWHLEKNCQHTVYNKLSSLMNDGAYLIFTHGAHDGEIIGEMWGERFYYSALDTNTVFELMKEAGLEIISSVENYKEKTTGERDLLIVARKINQP